MQMSPRREKMNPWFYYHGGCCLTCVAGGRWHNRPNTPNAKRVTLRSHRTGAVGGGTKASLKRITLKTKRDPQGPVFLFIIPAGRQTLLITENSNMHTSSLYDIPPPEPGSRRWL